MVRKPPFPFAWYNATIGASANYTNSTRAQVVAVDDTAKKSLGDIAFDIGLTVSAVNWSGRNDGTVANDHASQEASAKMQLMEYGIADTPKSGDPAGIRFGYTVAGQSGIRYETTPFSASDDYWKVYEIKVTVTQQSKGSPAVTYSAEEVAAALAASGVKYDLHIYRTDAKSIARFYTNANVTDHPESHDSNKPAPAAAGTAATSESKMLLSTPSTGTAFVAGETKYYIGMYVDGGDHTPNATDETGNFTVEISTHGA